MGKKKNHADETASYRILYLLFVSYRLLVSDTVAVKSIRAGREAGGPT